MNSVMAGDQFERWAAPPGPRGLPGSPHLRERLVRVGARAPLQEEGAQARHGLLHAHRQLLLGHEDVVQGQEVLLRSQRARLHREISLRHGCWRQRRGMRGPSRPANRAPLQTRFPAPDSPDPSSRSLRACGCSGRSNR